MKYKLTRIGLDTHTIINCDSVLVQYQPTSKKTIMFFMYNDPEDSSIQLIESMINVNEISLVHQIDEKVMHFGEKLQYQVLVEHKEDKEGYTGFSKFVDGWIIKDDIIKFEEYGNTEHKDINFDGITKINVNNLDVNENSDEEYNKGWVTIYDEDKGIKLISPLHLPKK